MKTQKVQLTTKESNYAKDCEILSRLLKDKMLSTVEFQRLQKCVDIRHGF